MKIALSSIVLLVGLAKFGFAQGSLTPPGAPAPTMKSLQDLSDQIALVQSPSQTHRFTAFADANATAAGAKQCTSIPIPAGNVVKFESVAATTYLDAGATAYFKYFGKIDASASRIMVQNIPIVATGIDPVPNTRSGVLQFPMWVTGGNSAAAAPGEVHTLQVCVQSSAGATASSSFVVTGTYAP
jgi:hypothetical protein